MDTHRLARLAGCLIAAVGLLTAGCSRQSMIEKVTSAEDRALGQKMVAALQSGDDAYVTGQLRGDLRAGAPEVLPQMRQLLPSGPGAAVRLVDGSSAASASTGGASVKQTRLSYEIDQGERHAVVEVEIVHEGGRTAVTQFHASPLKRPLDQPPPFALTGKSPLQYLVLALAVLAPITCLWAFIAALRTPALKFRWLWAIGSLIGVASVSVSWTTGALAFRPIYLMLLGAGVTGQGGDWIISVGVPVIALTFLLYERKRTPATAPG